MDMYGSTFDYTALGAALGVYAAIGSVIGILTIVAMWRIFSKASKPGWAALIPIYNVVVMFQIVGLNPWLILLYFVPIVNIIAAIVLAIMMCIRLAKAFGKSSGFAVGLFFLNTIFILILGFGDSQYVGISE